MFISSIYDILRKSIDGIYIFEYINEENCKDVPVNNYLVNVFKFLGVPDDFIHIIYNYNGHQTEEYRQSLYDLSPIQEYLTSEILEIPMRTYEEISNDRSGINGYAVSVNLGHIQIYDSFIKNRHNRVMVFESDSRLNLDVATLMKYIDNIPHDADFINFNPLYNTYLDAKNFVETFKTDEIFKEYYGITYDSSAYICSSRWAEHVKNFLHKNYVVIDTISFFFNNRCRELINADKLIPDYKKEEINFFIEKLKDMTVYNVKPYMVSYKNDTLYSILYIFR